MRDSAYIIREAIVDDRERICALLTHLELGTNSVLEPGTRYWIAEDPDGTVIGVVGLEYGEHAALLRSAAVHQDARNHGLGKTLVAHALQSAAMDRYRSVYLFSTGAGHYWIQHGFHEVSVVELVDMLPNTPQVRHYDASGWLPTEIAWRRDL